MCNFLDLERITVSFDKLYNNDCIIEKTCFIDKVSNIINTILIPLVGFLEVNPLAVKLLDNCLYIQGGYSMHKRTE